MPAKANNSAAIAKSDRPPANSKSNREPSLRDLRRRLVGFRYDLLRRLMVTMFVIGSAGLLASHLSPSRLAAEYPAAMADSRVAMTSLGASARDAIGHGYNRAAAILSSADVAATRSADTLEASAAGAAHSIAEAAHRGLQKREVASAKVSGVSPHGHKSRETAHAAAPVVTAASAAGHGSAGNWTLDDFATQFGNELSKAYYKFLDFAASVIDLDWAPGLRNSISSSIQSATNHFTAQGGFTLNDFTSLLGSIAETNALVAFGVGLLMFSVMLSVTAWIKRTGGR